MKARENRVHEDLIDSASTNTRVHPRHNRWLILIAAFKLAQAALFIAIGVGALKLVGKDLSDLLSQLADHLRFNPESKLVNFVLDRAAAVNDHMLRRIGAVVFIYAALDLAEGIGLYLEKVWGEYMTLIITGSFLPLEVYELFRRITWVRSGLFAINVMVLIYLLKVVLERGQERRANGTGDQG
jgi:uncharacterized membrane protein (DUF2068 family)